MRILISRYGGGKVCASGLSDGCVNKKWVFELLIKWRNACMNIWIYYIRKWSDGLRKGQICRWMVSEGMQESMIR